jgi:hypothetical protein
MVPARPPLTRAHFVQCGVAHCVTFLRVWIQHHRIAVVQSGQNFKEIRGYPRYVFRRSRRAMQQAPIAECVDTAELAAGDERRAGNQQSLFFSR